MNFTAEPAEDSVTSLALRWEAPSGSYDGYNLTYFPVGSEDPDKSVVRIADNMLPYILQGLAADTVYQLTLQSTADGEASDPITVRAKTSTKFQRVIFRQWHYVSKKCKRPVSADILNFSLV